ncbi:MAG TPA: type 1 glutamine amidotransferase, partial [Thermoguttaceae bacterium]|nr:type 1 glutamine amidotransferase [Thermoguttaceae bacterium]
MKRILILQHVPHETLGTIETALCKAKLPFEYLELFRAIPSRPDLSQAAGMVVLGGPMNVDQTDEFPFLAAEVDWIREAIDRGLPVLGVCLGSQLIAKALGASVRPNGIKEIGWYPLQLLAEAREDRLLRGCVPDQTVFQ